MDSNKRKEKLLKKINKEQSHGNRSNNVKETRKVKMPKVEVPSKEKKTGSVPKSSEKKAMYNNDKALKEKKMKQKVNREKQSYQNSLNGEPKGFDKVVDEVGKVPKFFNKVQNKIHSMSTINKVKMFGAWAVVIIAVVVICGIVLTSLSDSKKKAQREAEKEAATTQATTEEPANPLITCENEGVKNLVTSYITAMRDVNMDGMKSMDVCQDTYQSDTQFKNLATVIEDYQDITVYTKNGPYENGFMAYVVTNIKFKNIDKTCQGMFQYVVRPQEDGSYKIDTTPEDDIEDDDIVNKMTALSQSEDVLALIDSVNQQSQADIAADEKLKAYVEGTLCNVGGQTTNAPEQTTQAQDAQTTAASSEENKETQAAPDTTAASEETTQASSESKKNE